MERLTVGIGADGRSAFVLPDGREVVLLGGNYVVKGPPYFPPLGVVEADAKAMADGARAMEYKPSAGGREVRACVRLGCLMEGAMRRGGGMDPQWAASLDATVATFSAHGVYVLLDNHQDALCASTGGEGLPYWMAQEMQRDSPDESFTISPRHPLALSSLFGCLLKPLTGVHDIATVPGEPSPWSAFAEGGTDDARLVSLANASVRLNNHDAAWGEGRILFTKQCMNLGRRFFLAPFDAHDRTRLFNPFVAYLLHLGKVWERFENVVCIDMFNEPPFFGLPSASTFLSSRRHLFAFIGETLDALEAAGMKAPIAYEDVMGCVGGVRFGGGSSAFASALGCAGVPPAATRSLRAWATRRW